MPDKIFIKTYENHQGECLSQCFIKEGKDLHLLYDTYNVIKIDTILYHLSNKQRIYIFREEILSEELTNRYLIYNDIDNSLYRSDLEMLLNILTSKEVEQIWNDQGYYIGIIDSIESNFSNLYIKYHGTDKRNKLKLYKVETR